MKKTFLMAALVAATLSFSTGVSAMDCDKVVKTDKGTACITYVPVGKRKVGMVGDEPYPIHSGRGLEDGGEYYSENDYGADHFAPYERLKVTKTGRFND